VAVLAELDNTHASRSLGSGSGQCDAGGVDVGARGQGYKACLRNGCSGCSDDDSGRCKQGLASETKVWLCELKDKLDSMQRKELLPFNAAPLVRRLARVLAACGGGVR